MWVTERERELDKLRGYLQILVGTDRMTPDRARSVMREARAGEEFDFQAWLELNAAVTQW